MDSLDCVALERGFPRTKAGDKLVEEGELFTLADSRQFSPRWMKPVKEDKRSKELIAAAEAYQAERQGDAKDKLIREMKAKLAELGHTEE